MLLRRVFLLPTWPWSLRRFAGSAASYANHDEADECDQHDGSGAHPEDGSDGDAASNRGDQRQGGTAADGERNQADSGDTSPSA